MTAFLEDAPGDRSEVSVADATVVTVADFNSSTEEWELIGEFRDNAKARQACEGRRYAIILTCDAQEAARVNPGIQRTTDFVQA